MALRHALAATAVLATLVTGCGGAPGEPDPERTPSATPTPTASPFPSPTITRSEVPSRALPGAVLTADGLGPVRLGMPLAEARDRGWATELPHCRRWGAAPQLAAEGIDLVFADDRLTEIWLGNPTHRTADWARVGMHIEDVLGLYRERLKFERRNTVGGPMVVPFVHTGDREIVFFAVGDEDATPGLRSPVSAIGARAYGGAVERPRC